MAIDWISVAVPGHERFQVWLNGKPLETLNCIEAKAGERGFVVQLLYSLDNKPLLDEEGNPRTRVLFGRVELRELPRR